MPAYEVENLGYLFRPRGASSDDAASTLLGKLEAELRKRKIETVARSQEEVLKAIEPMVVSRYHRIIGVCVKHIRASQLTQDILIRKAETYLFAEDRRLFYVALTRVSGGTFLIANDRQPSSFIYEMVDIAGHDIRFEMADGHAVDICRECLISTMGNLQQPDGSVTRICSRAPACRHSEPTIGSRMIRS